MSMKVTKEQFIGVTYEELLAENAKLRELLAELYEEQCDECDRWKYRDRMRELGIEVDG